MPDASHVTSLRIQDLPVWKEAAAERTPLSFELELTARCANNCRHCYVNLPANDRAAQAVEISPLEIDSIADQAAQLGALWCLLTGGDPLLRRDFSEIYFRLKRRGFLVSVFTSATVVTDDHIRLFQAYPPRDLEVTVYGVTRETYERVTRRPGSFEALIRALHRFREAGLRVRLKAVALKSNLHEMDAIAQFCREHTSDFFRYDPVMHLRTDGDAARNREIQGERLGWQEIVRLEHKDKERLAALESACREPKSTLRHGQGHLFQCGAGNSTFFVSYDGKFRLCASLASPECTYDLRRGTLEDAWRRFVPRIRETHSCSPEFLDSCFECELMSLCLCCPAHAHLETGRLDAHVPYFCEVAHARAASLRELPAGEPAGAKSA